MADEKVRWQDTVENLDDKIDNVTGDVLIAAGFVAYLGPFTVSVQCSAQGAQLAALLSQPLAVAGQIHWEKGIGQEGARSLLGLSPFVPEAAQGSVGMETGGFRCVQQASCN